MPTMATRPGLAAMLHVLPSWLPGGKTTLAPIGTLRSLSGVTPMGHTWLPPIPHSSSNWSRKNGIVRVYLLLGYNL